MIKNILFLICLFFYSVSSHAALISRDWITVNDAALTYDTDTGLEWLDITVTAGFSYNEVTAELGVGGAYEGFEFASRQQVIDLFLAVDLQEIPNFPSAEGSKIQELLSYWGVTWYLGTGERTEFLTSNTSGLLSDEHWTGRVFWLEGGDTGATATIYVRDDDYKGFTIGSALVRPAVSVIIDGDVNDSKSVNVGDLLLILQVVLKEPVTPGIDPGRADLYPSGAPDGIINLSDLILLQKMIQ